MFIYGVKYPGNAAVAGLRANDIILKIDGRTVETLQDIEGSYTAAVDGIDEKHRILFVVLRNGLMRQVVLDFLRDYARE